MYILKHLYSLTGTIFFASHNLIIDGIHEIKDIGGNLEWIII